jgi:hypothetical protein
MFSKLSALAKAWGGRVRIISTDEYDKISDSDSSAFCEAPFSSYRLGVRWTAKEIICTRPYIWTEIVHEMGHVFACNDPPQRSHEYDFFGWEYALVRRIGGSVSDWVANNKDYGIFQEIAGVYIGEFSDASPKIREYLLDERVRHARMQGIIVGDQPIAIR